MNELAEAILRKIADQLKHGDGYITLYPNSACIDGWVDDLTDEEASYLASLDWPWDADIRH